MLVRFPLSSNRDVAILRTVASVPRVGYTRSWTNATPWSGSAIATWPGKAFTQMGLDHNLAKC